MVRWTMLGASPSPSHPPVALSQCGSLHFKQPKQSVGPSKVPRSPGFLNFKGPAFKVGGLWYPSTKGNLSIPSLPPDLKKSKDLTWFCCVKSLIEQRVLLFKKTKKKLINQRGAGVMPGL